jgi:hypothetical protein
MSEDKLQELLFLGKMYKEGQDFKKSNKPLGSYEKNLIANGAGSIKTIYPTSNESIKFYAMDSLVPEYITPEVVLGKIINLKQKLR